MIRKMVPIRELKTLGSSRRLTSRLLSQAARTGPTRSGGESVEFLSQIKVFEAIPARVVRAIRHQPL